MNWVTGVAVFAVIWWLVVFMVLPWGNRPIDSADASLGHAPSAPVKPRLMVKMAITTVIAALLWAIAFYVVNAGWITFREG
jgi:predicted secreted protein